MKPPNLKDIFRNAASVLDLKKERLYYSALLCRMPVKDTFNVFTR